VTDAGQNQSQLVSWNFADNTVTSLANGLYTGFDLEASDINNAGHWIIIGGGNGSVADQVFSASTVDGTLTGLGTLGFSNATSGSREVVSASFNDATGALWVYRQNDGFFSFNISDLSTLNEEIDRTGNIEAMAWNGAGDTLYYFDQRDLFSWDAINGEQLLADDLFTGGIEALEFDVDGRLLAGVENTSTSFDLVEISLVDFSLSTVGTYDAPSGDLETLALVPSPGAAALAGLGGLAALRRRR
jgi:MYXO-CTERM domain-containing protein